MRGGTDGGAKYDPSGKENDRKREGSPIAVIPGLPVSRKHSLTPLGSRGRRMVCEGGGMGHWSDGDRESYGRLVLHHPRRQMIVRCLLEM